ncbi:MAG TPA: hypothetical protein VM286_08850 [Candidatus Thermoplasmatota archaeon]|nr:hypothetical protein [Candidatus Thermoplasmatota archaeon]
MAQDRGDDLAGIVRPLASLASKSEKAQSKLAAGTWQHTMLQEDLAALRIGLALLDPDKEDPGRFARGELLAALAALDAMATRTEAALARFLPGTPQHTLQSRRLKALAAATAAVRARCGGAR